MTLTLTPSFVASAMSLLDIS
uniref:Pirin n=1 Tax=Rhizophora mucronata TaxID=61149 RepID=A0A2P2L737_RHIMU